MFDFSNKKTFKVVSTIIIILVVLALLLGLIAPGF